MADKPGKPEAEKPVLLYIIGGNSWDIPHNPDEVRKAFERHGYDVVILGAGEMREDDRGQKFRDLSGKRDILLKDVADEVDKLVKAGRSFTVYLDTHGFMEGDVHKLMLGDQFDLKKLYEDMGKQHPGAKQFTLTVKRGGETYRLYDNKLSFDTTKPMTLAGVEEAVQKIRSVGPSTITDDEIERGIQMPYGGGGIFGGSYKPITAEIRPEGSDKVYTIPFTRETATKDLLKTITGHAGKIPFSVFSTACYSGGACLDLTESTPRGTVFVGLSSGYEPVYVKDTENLIRYIYQQKKGELDIPLNAQNLLMLYMEHSMSPELGGRDQKVLPAPIAGVSGIGVLDLDKKLMEQMAKKPGDDALKEVIKLLGAKHKALTVNHPGTKEAAFTVDLVPLGMFRYEQDMLAEAAKVVHGNKPAAKLKESSLYGRAMAIALAADPTINDSFRNLRAYQDFFRALQEEYKGDRVALAKDALARGVAPDKVVKRIDGGLFRSYVSHEGAMTMAIKTENADLIRLLVKHKQALTEDHIAQAAALGNQEFAGNLLEMHGKKKLAAGDPLGSRLLAVAVRNKDEAMFRYLEGRGAVLDDKARTPRLIDSLFESRFTKNEYNHEKHLSFLKYLTEEKSVPVFEKGQQVGGVLYHAAHFGLGAFDYVLGASMKQSGKTASELLGQPERVGDDETLAHVIAAFGNADVLAVILKHRPDYLEKIAGWQGTPLIKAFVYGNYETAKKLLDLGANINVSDKFKDLGDMALDPIGNRQNRLAMVKLLVENGYNIYSQGKTRGGTLRERGGRNPEIDSYLEKREKEIEASANKFVKATKDMKKEEIIKKIQQKDSGFTPAVLRSIMELDDFEKSRKLPPRLTPEQHDTIEEVLQATPKVTYSRRADTLYTGAAMPSPDQFIVNGFQVASVVNIPAPGPPLFAAAQPFHLPDGRA